jgi:glucose-6-phosphate dehydrogenase assembly protein OpcA
MATTFKVLGQSNPAATTATTLYTVPAGTSAVISTLNICNLAAANSSFRIAVRPNGASLANSQYIAYDTGLLASDSISLTVGLTLGAADVVTVYSSTGNTAFSIFGSEIT